MKLNRRLHHSLFLSIMMLSLVVGAGAQSDDRSRLGADRRVFPPTPDFPSEPLAEATQSDLTALIESLINQDLSEHSESLKSLGKSSDLRIAWVLSDLLRITRDRKLREEVIRSAESLMSIDVDRSDAWVSVTDTLIAWDVPAFENYLDVKRDIYTLIVPEWERLMSDEGEVDWRFVSWGGVGIDNRPYDQTDRPINSISGVDNPTVTNAAGGSWLDDEAPVFGVLINGKARAYPRFIMEIREMVNDSLGGRDFAMPYCTLCGAAHVWFTDRVPDGIERPVLRTSGLLIRSNKLMYDVVSGSVFDTFLGDATNGPLYDRGISLPGHSVVSTTWAEWKKAHPKTTILVEKDSFGRDSDLRNTRDADGPIFPVGDVDPRLSVHEEVLGVVKPDGTPVAFQVAQAKEKLLAGKAVTLNGVELKLESGGLSAHAENGAPLVAHESFWFGWSQFRPETELWTSQ